MIKDFIETYYRMPIEVFTEWLIITLIVIWLMLSIIMAFTGYIEQEIQKTERGENPELFTVYRDTPNGEKGKIEREK